MVVHGFASFPRQGKFSLPESLLHLILLSGLLLEEEGDGDTLFRLQTFKRFVVLDFFDRNLKLLLHLPCRVLWLFDRC